MGKFLGVCCCFLIIVGCKSDDRNLYVKLGNKNFSELEEIALHGGYYKARLKAFEVLVARTKTDPNTRERVVDLLIQGLDDKNYLVQEHVLAYFKHVSNKRVVPKLIGLVESTSDKKIKEAAYFTLARNTEFSVVQLKAMILKDWWDKKGCYLPEEYFQRNLIPIFMADEVVEGGSTLHSVEFHNK